MSRTNNKENRVSPRVTEPEQFTLTIKSIPWTADTRPPVYRLRALLKTLLRGFGFKCISVERVKTPTPTQQREGR